ncbi:SEL1-like repeat protein [Methyloceanibacter methanicus]|uniref:SEL1-like repeat protein n=1 Tax=Methyloceanibacter methanicus TaxID=1774968 RepID=UPI001300F275|nr:SEL1-like repeat protein [Methyloceanibacter methanicus]
MEAPHDAPLDPSFDTPLGEPMDQRTVESLLRRLVDRVEETERRYGQALDELHARLDQLSQTTDAARSTSTPENAETFDRLHEQVSSLARRLESEPKTHLDDFERLGRVLTGGLRGDLDDDTVRAARPTPPPSPFAQSISSSRGPSHLAPDLEPADWAWEPKPLAPADFDNRLAEMANRLEQSIGAAMPSSTIEALNARLEEVGHQIAQSLEAAPNRAALEHVEQQIADMGRQLTRAEEQLGRLGGVEERLVQLLARLEDKDASRTTPEIDAAQLQEIAAKAAVEAARLVADDSQKTTERLEAMQRELNAVSSTSRQADDKLNSSLQSVHESLKELVQQVERPVARSPQTNPFVAKSERQRPRPAGPAAAASQPPRTRPPQTEAPDKDARPRAARATAPAPGPEANGIAARRPAPSSPDEAELRVKESLRSRLDATGANVKPRNLLAAFERARAPHVEGSPQARTPEPESDWEAGASDDMVAAARRAAQAAAAQAAALAESREDRRPLRAPVLDTAPAEQASGRKRPYLIISAAILLTISALLLYGRLGSKTADDVGALPQSGAGQPAAEGTPAEAGQGPGDQQSGSFRLLPTPEIAPIPGMVPLQDRVGQAVPGVTDIPKSPARGMPASEITPAPQLASLKSTEAAALPGDVEFSVEEPASATEVAMAEKLTATSVSGPMPPAALGSEDLREAASKGYPMAQYTVAVRYIDGLGTMADPKTGAEWMERAARGGLAPAQYRLGTMYERGVGVTANIDTARSWYLAAAERGNIKAMHNLAVSVSGGGGTTPNYALASKWYGEAALRGLADSQFNLGILAEHGLGRSKDLADAYKWYVLAAKQGDTEAQKRRDLVAAKLPAETIVAVDGKVANWKPKAISPEANTVAEPDSWGGKTSAAAETKPPQGSTLVSRAQTLLNKLGYDVGIPDGLSGEKTRAGVKRFQQRNGLAETGEVTVPLVAQLEALAS